MKKMEILLKGRRSEWMKWSNSWMKKWRNLWKDEEISVKMEKLIKRKKKWMKRWPNEWKDD
jgi:hypothetical protein